MNRMPKLPCLKCGGKHKVGDECKKIDIKQADTLAAPFLKRIDGLEQSCRFLEVQLAAKEAELTQLRGLLEEAVELLNGYEQMRQNVMGAVSLAVAHGITWPQDQIDLAMKTIAGREAFLAKAKKEGV